MNKFAERLKELREERNLTQTQLAQLTGVSQSAITYWENNIRTPNIEAVITLADFFDVSIDYLVGRVD